MMTSGVYEHKPLSEKHKERISKAKKGQIPWNKDKIMPKEFREEVSKSKRGKPNGRLGTHHSEEAKRKISVNNGRGMLDKHHSRKTKQKIKEGNLGKFVSEETKRRLSEAHKGQLPWNKGLTKKIDNKLAQSVETKKKMSEVHKGHFVSEKTKLKIGTANKGKIRSEEVKKKMSEIHKGEKCNWWKGGISFEPYTLEFNRQLKELIRRRDNYQCQLCGMPECENMSKLDTHHIDYDKKNCLPSNLISLCRSCHIKTNTNREYWTDYFNDIELRGE